MFKKLFLQILLLCLPLNIVKLQAKDDKSVASFAITDYKVLAPELGKALVDQGYIEKLYQSGEQTALTKLVKGCYHILDGKLRRTNQVHNAAHYLTPAITAKLILAVTGNYDQETLIKEWQAASKEHKLQRSHIKDLIKLLNNALIETKDSHLSHLPLAVVIGTLSLHPEAASQIEDFKNAIAQINNDYSDLSLVYDFDSLHIKQLSYPPAFTSINLGYNGKTSAPPCVEDALRNICYALLWNTETACLDLTQINQDLKLNSNFLKFISKYQDGKNLTSIECAQDWLNLVSGLDNVEYFRTDYELCGHVENGLKVLNYLFSTKAKSLSQFLDQVSSKQKHSFAGNYGVGEITLKKGNCDFKILVNFARGHAQAHMHRPNINQADIARSLIDQIGNDLSKCHQKIGLLLLLSKFKDLYSLDWAIQYDKTNLAKLLINATYNYDRKTALLLAAEKGHTGIATLLIDSGADVNAKDNNGKSTLFYAANNGNTEIVKLLIAASADVNAKDIGGSTALIGAANNGHTEIVKLLITAGANGDEALIYAANNGHTEIVKLLIAAKADVNTRNINGSTALMSAANNGHTEIVKLLITAGANSDEALIYAANNGHTEIVKLLIAAKADVNTKDRYGSTALMSAANNGHTEIVKLLITAGANDDKALIYAANNGHTEIVKLLIDAGADVNAKTCNGFTALMAAPQYGRTEIAKLLIAASADVNAKDIGGYTALMYAASDGHTEIVKLIIDAGADVNAKNNGGWTSLMYAAIDGRTEIVKLLIAAGADVNTKVDYGRTALWYAANNGHTEIVKLLIAAGADVNHIDYFDITALKLSIANNHEDCAKLLINAGADCSGIDKITLFKLKHPNLVKAVLFSLIVGIGYNLAENSNS